MKEKIVKLMKNEGLTSSRLAEILEIQPSGISHIVSGRNKPGFDLLQKILRRFPRINPDWLLLDSGEMYRDGETPTAAPLDVASLGDSLPIDLFGLDGMVMGVPQSSSETGSSRQNGALSGGEQSRNRGGNLANGTTPNGASFGSQNGSQNRVQNGTQNSTQNNPQFAWQNSQNNGSNLVSIERIIVLYSDGTFRCYNQ